MRSCAGVLALAILAFALILVGALTGAAWLPLR
jgi:hypothetical protein